MTTPQTDTLSRLAVAGFALASVEPDGSAVAVLRLDSGRVAKRLRIGLDGGARTA